MDKRIKIGIVGAGSYTSGVLLKRLATHPYASIEYLAEVSPYTADDVCKLHPHLKNLISLPVFEFNAEKIAQNCEIVFFSQPAGGSTTGIARLLELNPKIKIIDLGADLRLKEPSLYQQWYKFNHGQPELLKKSVYGLPELYREKIANASLIANPGCYPTSAILALAPVVANKLIKPDKIIINACSGISGAGRSYKEGFNLFIDVYNNFRPYKVGMHQHIPEIEQELSFLYGSPTKVIFVPYVLPTERGILTTCYIEPVKKISEEELIDLYRNFYKNEYFIRVLPLGEYPQLRSVVDTNFCDIGIHIDQRTDTYIIFSAIDNAVKGASGTAIQNMNILAGLDERLGLA